MEILFAPFIELTSEQYFFIGLGVAILYFAFRFAIWFYRVTLAFLFDEPADKLPSSGRNYIKNWFEDCDDDKFYIDHDNKGDVWFSHFFSMVILVIHSAFWGVVAFCLVPAVNYTWFISGILATYFGVMYLARSVIRLNKKLEKHTSDPNAHTKGGYDD